MRRGILFLSLFFVFETWAKAAPVVGNHAAADYFKKRMNDPQVRARKGKKSIKYSDHFLMLHIGGFIEDDSYNWGDSGGKDVGSMSLGLSYRMSEWTNSTDFLLRIDFSSFKLKEESPQKMSVMALAMLPDAKSGFPLYFGGGVGAGVFFKQIKGESTISLDYQMFVGLRFYDVYDGLGLFLESGIKNHLHILSDGQFNSKYINAGTVFVF